MVESGIAAVALLVGRVLFGGLLAVQGLSHFTGTEEMAGYAQAKGLPAPRVSVLASGGLLVAGGLALVVGILPGVAAGAVALFLVVSAVAMHDFWAVPEDQQQDEMVQFMKNIELAGAALVFLAVSTLEWGYALGIGL